MPEIVINACHGGFGLSDEAIKLLFKYKGWKLVTQDTTYQTTLFYRDYIDDTNWFSERDLNRDDPELVRVVKELKGKASDQYAELKIVKIPEGVHWYIEEYDGLEHVAEVHRTWY